jgi:RNA polymerase sigma-70 factor (ECF subfamily)
MEKKNFNQVYSDNKLKVEKYVKLKVYPHLECADEIVNDVFLKVYQNLETFNPEKSQLTTWIFNITKNTLIDYFRSIKLEKESKTNYLDSKHQTDAMYNLNSDSSADGAMIYSESIEAVKTAIKKLDPQMQMIAELRYFKQYQYDEIVAELNIPMGTVKTSINRIKSFLIKNTELV